jgi:cyclase
MSRTTVLTLLLLVGGTPIALRALQSQPQPSGPNVAEIEKVKDNLYMIKGGGGNTAAFVTARGVVIVDTKLVGWGQAILDKVKTVTDKPVTTIINTHTHRDHVGSNAEFPATVEVVAHENTKANMQKMEAFATPAQQAYLPKKTYADKLSLLQGPERIDLYHFGRGHTNGDTIVVFAGLRTAHTGDLFAAKGTPFIDASNGGSGVEYPKTLAKALAGIKDVDTIIPGHSAVTDWMALRDFADFNKDFLAAVEAAAKSGQSAEAAAAALVLPDRYKDYAKNRLKENVATIYAELGK